MKGLRMVHTHRESPPDSGEVQWQGLVWARCVKVSQGNKVGERQKKMKSHVEICEKG